jgi:4-hydroxy-tetrahydrodipicolinate synthase
MTKLAPGIYSAMSTPFADDGTVDDQRLRQLVDTTIEAGVAGLVCCGSTGEFTSLTDAERRHVVEVVIAHADGRVAVVPQTGAAATAQAVELTRHAAESGADGVLAISPYYEPIGLDEIQRYYEALSAAAELPIVIYNLPVGTGQNLKPAFVARLAREIEHVGYVKDSTGDFTQLGQLVTDYADDIEVFNGGDTILLPALELGVYGAIVGSANFVGVECCQIATAFSEGRLDEALEIFKHVYPVMQFLTVEGHYAALVKGALELIGEPAGTPRPPVEALRGDVRDRFAAVLAQVDRFQAAIPA